MYTCRVSVVLMSISAPDCQTSSSNDFAIIEDSQSEENSDGEDVSLKCHNTIELANCTVTWKCGSILVLHRRTKYDFKYY